MPADPAELAESGVPPQRGSSRRGRGAGDGGAVAQSGHDPSSARTSPPSSAPSDADLLALVRGGADAAYEELYHRHAEAVRRYARCCCHDAHTAEDLTGEVFARTLQAIRHGAGPETAVRAYLMATVRRVAAAWSKTSRREELVEDFAVFAESARRSSARGGSADSDVAAEVRAMHDAERTLAVRAFRSLPERYQTVLWHTTVEKESARQVGLLLGLTENATSVLAHRAREKLKQAYLQEHVSSSLTAGGDCARYADRLGAYARGGLRSRAERGVRDHLEQCARCRSAATEVADVNARLRSLLPVAVIGWFAGETTVTAVAGSAAGSTAGAAAVGGASPPGAAAGGQGSGATGGGHAMGPVLKAGVAAGVVVAAGALAYALVGSSSRSEEADAPPSAPPSTGHPSPAVSPPSPPGRAPVPAHPTTAPSHPTPPPPESSGTPGPQRTPPPKAPPRQPTRAVPSPSHSATERPTSPAPSPSSAVPSPPPPPVPTSYPLADLPVGVSAGGPGPMVRLFDSGPLLQRRSVSIGGTDHGHGVSVLAPSTVTIELNGPCTSYEALVGVDDDLTPRGAGSLRFTVYGDDERLWTSEPIRRGQPGTAVNVPLTGHTTVRLEVVRADGTGGLTMGDWARSVFHCR